MNSAQLRGKIDMYSYADRFTFKHNNDKKVFSELEKIEGGEYDKEEGLWIFSLSRHQIAVKQIIINNTIRTEVVKHKREEFDTRTQQKDPESRNKDESEGRKASGPWKMSELRNKEESGEKSENDKKANKIKHQADRKINDDEDPKASHKINHEVDHEANHDVEHELNHEVKNEKSEVLRVSEVELLEHFRKVMIIRNLSQRTIDSYLSYVKKFLIHFRGRQYKEICSWEIQQYLHYINKEKGYAYQTLNTWISSIKSFYKTVYKIHIAAIDIPRPKKEKRLPTYVKPFELEAMVASGTNLKHKTILILFFSTGIRKEELINLKVSSIDLITDEIRIFGKGKKERIAYIRESLHGHLESYLKAYKPKTYLFEGQQGGKYSLSSVGNVVKNAGRRAGIARPITPHALRHGFATLLITTGVDTSYVQKLLGHSSIKTTMIYTHLSDKNLRNLPDPLEGLNL